MQFRNRFLERASEQVLHAVGSRASGARRSSLAAVRRSRARMPSTDEQAPLLATPSADGEKHPRVVPGASRTLRGTLLSLAGVFAVLACSSVVVIERRNALRQAEVDSIYARSSAIVAQQPSYCNECAVIIPSDTYEGKNLGSFIDSSDCVVRFNAHSPQSCADDVAGSTAPPPRITAPRTTSAS